MKQTQQQPQTYTHLLFDADGTLFDYDRGETKALAATFQATGIPYKADYTNTYRHDYMTTYHHN